MVTPPRTERREEGGKYTGSRCPQCIFSPHHTDLREELLLPGDPKEMSGPLGLPELWASKAFVVPEANLPLGQKLKGQYLLNE